MKKEAKFGLSALLIVGIVFSLLGLVYLVLGLDLGNASGLEGDDVYVGPVFFTLGCIFLILGGIFLTVEIRKKRQADALIAEGRYIWGQIEDFIPNYNVRINGRCVYVAMVRYTDPAGTVHIFRSRNLKTYPDKAAVGKQVKVFIRDETYKPYYVDMDGILGHIVEH